MERYSARQVERALAQEQLLLRLDQGEDFEALCQELGLFLSQQADSGSDYPALPSRRRRTRSAHAQRSGPGDDHMTRTLLPLVQHFVTLVGREQVRGIVAQAETIHAFRPLREDLLRITYAYYAAELLDLFVEEGIENRPLFDLLLAMLGWLGDASDLDLTTRFFELRLLSLLGYRPQLFQCVACRRQIEPVTNFFSAADGGVLCADCGGNHRGAQEITLNALKVLRFMQTRDYDTCRRLRLSRPLHRELETVMYHYITYTLERNLKSVKFLKTLRRQQIENR